MTGLASRPAKVIRDAVDEAWGVHCEVCKGLGFLAEAHTHRINPCPHCEPCCGDPNDCNENCP